jgi:hypothetical protein
MDRVKRVFDLLFLQEQIKGIIISGSSVATGSPSQADFFKTGQVDAGVLEEGRERPQPDKFASIDGMRAEVQQLRAIGVVAGGGDADGGCDTQWWQQRACEGVGFYVFRCVFRYVCIQVCMYSNMYVFS